MKLIRAATPKAIETTFYVTGDTGVNYTVHFKRHQTKHRRVWTCNCRDFTERQVFTGGTCKHIDFVIISLDAPMPQSNNVLTTGAEPAETYQTTPTAKSVLEQVVSLLNKRYTPEERFEGDHLWSILSALRGPDKQFSYSLKEKTTARLRHSIGLKGTSRFTIDSNAPVASFTAKQYPHDDHFIHHYELALEALTALGYLK